MRRILHGLSLALALISVVMIAVGCGGLSSLERLAPPGTFGSGVNSPFIGLWTLSDVSVGGVSTGCPGTVTSGGTSYTCEAINRAFIAGGSFNDTAPADQVGSGTWSIDTNNNLTITKGSTSTVGVVTFNGTLTQFVYVVGVESYTWIKSS